MRIRFTVVSLGSEKRFSRREQSNMPSATPSTINMPYHFTSMPKTRNATGSMNRIPPYARTSKSQATEPERTSCMRRFTG